MQFVEREEQRRRVALADPPLRGVVEMLEVFRCDAFDDAEDVEVRMAHAEFGSDGRAVEHDGFQVGCGCGTRPYRNKLSPAAAGAAATERASASTTEPAATAAESSAAKSASAPAAASDAAGDQRADPPAAATAATASGTATARHYRVQNENEDS